MSFQISDSRQKLAIPSSGSYEGASILSLKMPAHNGGAHPSDELPAKLPAIMLPQALSQKWLTGATKAAVPYVITSLGAQCEVDTWCYVPEVVGAVGEPPPGFVGKFLTSARY
jgi:hypothetical protein